MASSLFSNFYTFIPSWLQLCEGSSGDQLLVGDMLRKGWAKKVGMIWNSMFSLLGMPIKMGVVLTVMGVYMVICVAMDLVWLKLWFHFCSLVIKVLILQTSILT